MKFLITHFQMRKWSNEGTSPTTDSKHYRALLLARKLKRANVLAMQATHDSTHPSPRSHAWHLSLVNTLECCFNQNKRNSVRKAIFVPYGETLESPRKHWHTSYNLIKDSATKEYNNCLNCAKLPTKHNKNSMHYKRSFNQRDICRYIPVTSNRS